MSRYFLLILCALVFALSACESKNNQKELRIAIWAHYLSSETLKKFETEHAVKLRISHYSSNEELLAKIQLNPESFDMAVPSDYMVRILRQQGLLTALDHQKITHFKNIEPRFRGLSYDPQNQYSIPYAWTTSGIAIRSDIKTKSLPSLRELFESADFSGQVSALDDMRELFAAALKVHGLSVNTKKETEIQKAFEYLKIHKTQFKTFNSNAVDLLLNQEIRAGLVYSSDALLAQKTDPKIQFHIPKEGSTWALDNWVILKSSKNKELAHQFIQFLLTPENNRDLVLNVRVSPVVRGTKALLPLELQKNLTLFPEKTTLENLEMLGDLGSAQVLYEKFWTDFKVL